MILVNPINAVLNKVVMLLQICGTASCFKVVLKVICNVSTCARMRMCIERSCDYLMRRYSEWLIAYAFFTVIFC